MKKLISVLVTIAMCASLIACVSAAEEQTLVMTIDSPVMTVDGVEAEVDPGADTAPIILNDRTVLPVRAAVEALGGEVEWDADTRTATLTYEENKIDLVIDSTTAYLNDEEQTLDVAPVIINDRTFLPIRFIAEGFGWNVGWNDATKEVTIVKPATEETAAEDKNETAYVGTNEFDLEKGTVLLNNGIEMPIIGIGTFTLTDEQAEDSVYWALAAGARLIDTAAAYGNEEGVGRGIKKAIDEGIVEREEIFVTTKLWPSNYNSEAIDTALEKLGLDYIDLMLLHQPMGDYIGGYKAMEQGVADGKLRAIGLSNFSDVQFKEVADQAEILPAVHQVETHLHNQQVAMRGFLDQYSTVLESWFPLGGRGNTQVFLNDETVVAIAEAHGKSSAQIILRWHLQDGHIAIPGSNNPDHIAENVDLFDFELTDEEMASLRALDQGAGFFPGLGSTSEETQKIFNGWSERWGIDIGNGEQTENEE